MNILVIRDHEEASSGMGQTILEMPDDVTDEMKANDYFVAWLRQHSGYYKDKSREDCLCAEYGWGLDQTVPPPLLPSKEEAEQIEVRSREKKAVEAEQRAKENYERARQELEKARRTSTNGPVKACILLLLLPFLFGCQGGLRTREATEHDLICSDLYRSAKRYAEMRGLEKPKGLLADWQITNAKQKALDEKSPLDARLEDLACIVDGYAKSLPEASAKVVLPTSVYIQRLTDIFSSKESRMLIALYDSRVVELDLERRRCVEQSLKGN
jgi:hypothetical protein